MKKIVGIDIGGTYIKGGLVDEEGNIIFSTLVDSNCDKGEQAILDSLVGIINIILENTNTKKSEIEGIGIGIPGYIDSEKGEIVYSNNLAVRNVKIAKYISEIFGKPVKIGNDANVAALGEATFGVGKNYASSIMITLGTGLGSGIIIDNKIFEGNKSCGGEVGHMIMNFDSSEKCTCGNYGCFEVFASATALVRETKKAMQKHPESKMWEVSKTLDAVNGKTSFAVSDCDVVAKEVVDTYITNIAIGLVNIVNIFRPECIMLGGGICNEGERLLKPIREFVKTHRYGGDGSPEVEILVAKLKNDAGILGAACLIQN